VCERLAQIRQSMCLWAESFDADCVSPAQALQVLKDASAISNIALTIKALVAPRAAGVLGAAASSAAASAAAASGPASGATGSCTSISAAHELARASGTTISSAQASLELGKRLGFQAEVQAAAKRGELSQQQVELVSQAAELDPAAAEELVELAKTSSLHELKQTVATIKAASRADPEAHRRDIKARRRLRTWTDTEGIWHISGLAM
jgi:hypothetical protein